MAEQKKKGPSGLMRIIRLLVIGVIGIVVVFVGVGFAMPRNWSVSRNVVIKADMDDIHEYTGDLKKWPEWQPWKKHDPSIAVTIGDKHEGPGASQTWTSKDGPGKVTFTGSSEDKGVQYDMEFSGMPSKGEIKYEKVEGGVRVTWEMHGDWGNNLMGRMISPMMQGQIEKMFEEGLNDLKAKVEKK
jgi:hypothetical protein